MIGHWSDCAVHNEPASPAGPCDCGGITAISEQQHIKALSIGQGTQTERNRQYTLDPQPIINKDAPAFPLSPEQQKMIDDLVAGGAVIAGLGLASGNLYLGYRRDGQFCIALAQAAYHGSFGDTAFTRWAEKRGIDADGAFRRAYDDANGIAPDAAEIVRGLDVIEQQRVDAHAGTYELWNMPAVAMPQISSGSMTISVDSDVQINGKTLKAGESITFVAEDVLSSSRVISNWFPSAAAHTVKRSGIQGWKVEQEKPADIMAITRGMCK